MSAAADTTKGNGLGMKDFSAENANKADNRKARKAAESDAATSADRNGALQRCYGKIGISAVAAAARYQGAAKNPAYAPAMLKPHHEAGDAA